MGYGGKKFTTRDLTLMQRETLETIYWGEFRIDIHPSKFKPQKIVNTDGIDISSRLLSLYRRRLITRKTVDYEPVIMCTSAGRSEVERHG